MRILVAPDAFKGTLDAGEAARAIASGLGCAIPDARIDELPLADGGEGTLSVVAGHLPGRWEELEGGRVWISGGDAWVEAAGFIGLNHPAMAGPVLERTSLALGRLLALLNRRGTGRIHLALGGTATVDGGLGMLVGMGARILDARGREVAPTPAGLLATETFRIERLPRPGPAGFRVLVDVAAPLLGEEGAVMRFGPQKGLRPEMLAPMERAMARWAEALERKTGMRCRDRPGAGAAGGIGFAAACLGAELGSGAEVMLEISGFDARLAGADWVLTGEGCADAQTAQGKLAWAVAKRARAAGVPVALLAGRVREPERLGQSFALIEAAQQEAETPTPQEARARLAAAAERLGRRIARGGEDGG